MSKKDNFDHEMVAEIGGRIRELRTAIEPNATIFAAERGIDRNYWGRIERGGTNMSVSTLAMVAETLGVDMAEIVRGIRRTR